MNPFVKTARVAITSTLVAGSLATASVVFSPLAQADYSPLAATATVNVRQGPDTSSSVLATLSSGDTVTQRGAEQDGWLPITYNGANAWIQAQYVASTTAATQKDQISTAELTADAYVRTAANANAWVLGTAHTGDKVGITGQASGDYTPVNFYGRAGWIATKLLSSADASVTSIKITTAISSDYLWVRGGESTAAQSIGMLYPGDRVDVTGDPVGGWVPINFNGKTAFVAANYSRYLTDPTVVTLSTKTDVTNKDTATSTGTDSSAAGGSTATTPTTTAPTTSAPATEPTTTPPATTEPTTPPATTQTAASTKYTTADVNVRVGPGIDQQSVTVLKENSQVAATGKTSGDWTEVSYDGASRWISSQYLSDTKQAEAPSPAPAPDPTPAGPTGSRWTTAALNAYGSSTQPKPATTVVPEGTQVELTGKQADGRSEYTWNGTTYWSATEYLGTNAPATNTSANTAKPGANAVETAINFAMSKLGGPYVWGGTGPVGYDCSGLMQAAYAAAGVTLPRVTWDQVNAGKQVSVGDLQPGDLVFFYDNGHVGMYIGNGNIVNALNEDAGIVVTPISYMPISAAVRIA
ncbi:SH3 domain-containing protein [Propionibacterium freudenreichii]|uniref:SH3 domain-containing protein n=1 Tax=Propionibacterium freudenreichii TaxID=1744 RepID=UPI0005A5C424|nr:SH3 domain-containing protein [Propionibacterium freudenreichii]CEI32738.1 cell-wall peptidases, NlpC/P60 family secreted protein [Propionibacterium freudenreichii]